MRANWARFSAVESGLAPMSSRTNGRPAEIIWTASAGRSMPGSVPRISLPAAIPAPVWPAVTTASASPALTSSVATTIELRFLRTRARAGCSSIPISSGAWTIARVGGQRAGVGSHDGLVADEDDGVLRGSRARTRGRPGTTSAGAVVAAHRVDRDPDAGAACRRG